MRFQALAVAQNVNHLARARFLGAAEGFLFQRGDPSRFVTRRRVLINRLIVGNEVLLEVVHHGDGFFKRLLVAAVAHQNTFRTEHLRHLGQHRRAAVGDHIVREAPQHRVGGDTGQAIRPSALQTKLQLAQLARLALVVAHHLIQLMKLFDARFHFVVLMLAHHKVHALRVKLTERLAEGVHLIVLAAQANHQHRARVRVAHHVLQHGSGVDVVVTQLGAAVGVAEQMHAVSPFGIVGLFQEARLDLTRNPVHAADGREDPQLVADPHVAVCAAVDLHPTIRRLNAFCR